MYNINGLNQMIKGYIDHGFSVQKAIEQLYENDQRYLKENILLREELNKSKDGYGFSQIIFDECMTIMTRDNSNLHIIPNEHTKYIKEALEEKWNRDINRT